MKLKQILFGGLLLAVPFTACTNEELLEVNAPAANLEEAIALGEGYTIVGTKGVDSRFVINSDFSATWETTDTVGGVWIGYQTAEQVAGGADAFTNLVATLGKVMSNHPFAFSKDLGGMKSVEFKAPTNVFQGKHILYYPYDAKMKAVADNVPVKFDANPVMDCTAGKELDHVNANTFAWTTIDAQGGPLAGEFDLKQAGNIWVIKLGADAANIDRTEGQTVEKVIIESAGALYNEAYISQNGKSKYAEFLGQYNNGAAINTYILTPENTTADYEISAAGTAGLTKKPFYLSMLPANKDIETLTVRVIMGNGRIFSKTLNKDENEDLFEEIIKAGQKVELSVILDTEEDADKIYTVDQFKKAIAASNPGDIVLGADITLDEFTFNKEDKTVNISGANLIVEGDIEVEAGTLTIENLVAEEGTITVGDDANFTFTSAKEVGALIVSGSATATANKFTTANVQRAAVLSLTGTGTTPAMTGALKIARAADVTLTGLTLKGATTNNEGELTMDNVVNKATFTSNGGYVSGTWTNVSTVNLKEATVEGLTNNGTVNVSGEEGSVDITNADADAANSLSAGVVNVKMTEEESELVTAITNEAGSKLNIEKGIVVEADDNVITLAAEALIEVSKAGQLVLADFANESTNYAGRIIINDMNDVIEEGGSECPAFTNADVAVKITDKKHITAGGADAKAYDNVNVNTLIMAGNFEVNTDYATILAAKNLEVTSSFSMSANLTMGSGNTFAVNGSVTISGKNNAVQTLTINGTENWIKGSLVLGKNISLSGSSAEIISINGAQLSIASGSTGVITGVTLTF